MYESLLRERAAKLAMTTAAREAVALHAVIFHRGGIRYATELGRLQEIQVCRTITRLPSVPGHCLGVMNMRGAIVPVFDLPLLFDETAKALDPPQRILIVDSGAVRIGLGADEVDDAVGLGAGEIDPPLVTFTGSRARLVRGIARGALLLDCKSLIDSDALVVG